MMSDYTPGPWNWHECFDPTGKRITSLDVVAEGGHSLTGVAVLASVFTNEADARLIAASPDMFEAGQEAIDAIEGLTGTIPEARLDAIMSAYGSLRAAIAKAKGAQ